MNDFVENFESELIIESPGRINLIGEHIDYNGGYVFPAAINKTIVFKFRRNGLEDICNIYSSNYDEQHTIHLDRLKPGSISWINYIIGVLHGINVLYPNAIKGFDLIIESNLPMGSGLSSSAALECGIAKGIDELFDLELDAISLIKLCQKAEHDFAGTKCGIMDQFAVYMGKKDHLILLDCESLNYDLIKNELDPYCLVLLNTKVAHSLADSAYNERRQECETAFSVLKNHFPTLKNLVSATEEMIESVKDEFSEKQYMRAIYSSQENNRVLKAVLAIKNNDLIGLGKLMNASHDGLSNLFEVSCEELDFLVDFARSTNKVLGARMMGGGFGGSTINLIHSDDVDSFVEEASKEYKNKYSIDLEALEVQLHQGTQKLAVNV